MMKIKAYTPQEYRKIIRELEKQNISFKTLSKWTDEVHVIECKSDKIQGYTVQNANPTS